jgi:replicative DNA helicase
MHTEASCLPSELFKPIVGMAALTSTAFYHLVRLNEHDSSVMGLPTGLAKLDRLLGGLQEGEVTVMAGRPMVGKTALAVEIAANLALAGENARRVGILSLDLIDEWLVIRMLYNRAEVNERDIRDNKLKPHQWSHVVAMADMLKKSLVFIDDDRESDIDSLCSRIRNLHAQYKIQIAIIDHLRLPADAAGTSSFCRDATKRMLDSFKILAKELSISIVVMLALPPAVASAGANLPDMSIFLEEAGEGADTVIALQPEMALETPRKRAQLLKMITAAIIKHRHGAIGNVPLYFNPTHLRFYPDPKKKRPVHAAILD